MKISSVSSRRLAIAATAACLVAAGSAQAATTTAAMAVQAVVPVSCTGFVGTTMDFGPLTTSLALAVSQADNTGTIGVTCTNGTTYSITAGGGNNNSSGWRMANGSNFMTYGLYTSSARSTTFPASGITVGGTGNGVLQTVTIYGRVPAQTVNAAGTYSDSVSFTITY